MTWFVVFSILFCKFGSFFYQTCLTTFFLQSRDFTETMTISDFFFCVFFTLIPKLNPLADFRRTSWLTSTLTFTVFVVRIIKFRLNFVRMFNIILFFFMLIQLFLNPADSLMNSVNIFLSTLSEIARVGLIPTFFWRTLTRASSKSLHTHVIGSVF